MLTAIEWAIIATVAFGLGSLCGVVGTAVGFLVADGQRPCGPKPAPAEKQGEYAGANFVSIYLGDTLQEAPSPPPDDESEAWKRRN